MKNVWLLGDSMRMSYENYVQQNCNDIKVFSPSENCRFSAYMLNSLRFWLPSFDKPDIIFFNAGLWDTALLYVDDGPFTDKETYIRNILSIARELGRYGVPIYFLNNTPVNAEKISAVATPSFDDPDAKTVFKQDNNRIAEYNAAVTKALNEKGITVIDLFSLIIDKRDQYLSPDGIHANESGIKLIGDIIIKTIQQTIL